MQPYRPTVGLNGLGGDYSGPRPPPGRRDPPAVHPLGPGEGTVARFMSLRYFYILLFVKQIMVRVPYAGARLGIRVSLVAQT